MLGRNSYNVSESGNIWVISQNLRHITLSVMQESHAQFVPYKLIKCFFFFVVHAIYLCIYIYICIVDVYALVKKNRSIE